MPPSLETPQKLSKEEDADVAAALEVVQESPEKAAAEKGPAADAEMAEAPAEMSTEERHRMEKQALRSELAAQQERCARLLRGREAIEKQLSVILRRFNTLKE